MLKRLKILLIFFSLLQLSPRLVVAYPMGTAASLPPPTKAFEKDDLPLLATLLNMTVYSDSNNKNLYYYVPFFRLFQYDQGLATSLLNIVKADNVFKAYNRMNRMQSVEEVVPEQVLNGPSIAFKKECLARETNFIEEDRERLSKNLEFISESIRIDKENLNNAVKNENHRMINYYKNSLIQREAEWQKEKQEGENRIGQEVAKLEQSEQELDELINKEIESWRRRRLFGIVTHLASAGKSIDITKHTTTNSLVVAINNTIDELKKSNGGYFTLSIYSGFTPNQLKDIRLLKNKYWPEIDVLLMPADDLQFTPLAQVEDSSAHPRENIMFKDMKSFGGYYGTTVHSDITIDGVVSIGMALGPFILPIGVSATIKDRVEPFRGSVTCKYNNDFWKHGRADVTEGWIIFDKDMIHSIKTEKNRDANCEVIVEKGDPKSVHDLALRKIEVNFEKNFFQKTYLAQAEAQKYYENASNNIDQHGKGKDQISWLNYLIPFFGKSLSIQALSTAKKSYWHTSKFNTGNADRLNFTHKIDIPEVRALRKNMPTLLCLSYNLKKHAYFRCTSEEETLAENSLVATRRAFSSPECQNAETIYGCTAKRQNAQESKPQKKDKVVDNSLGI